MYARELTDMQSAGAEFQVSLPTQVVAHIVLPSDMTTAKE